jgi:nicotinamidase-related amidase
MNRLSKTAELAGLSAAMSPSLNTAVTFPGTVLVVVDMQPGYPAALDALTQWFVKQEILRHREQNLPILLVEFDAHEMGETFDCIKSLIEGYDRGRIISKRGDDGSAEILKACRQFGFSPDSFRICGVNSDACVLETVQGLVVKHPTCLITIPQDACNCLTGKSNDVWSVDYPAIAQVTVELHGQMH